MASNQFTVEYAKTGRSKCKHTKCKQTIEAGEVRIGKISPNPFGSGDGDMTQYYHPGCLFEMFTRARAGTKTITSESDFHSGWSSLKASDQAAIRDLLTGKTTPSVGGAAPAAKGKKKAAPKKKAAAKKRKASSDESGGSEEEEESEEKPKKKTTKGKKK